MSDESTRATTPRASKADAETELVDVEPSAEPSTEPTPGPSAEPSTDVDQPAAEAEASEQLAKAYYVEAPVPPKKKGNRGLGVLVAVLAAVVFAALYAVAVAIIRSVQGGRFAFDFLLLPPYYVPVLFFLGAFVLLVLLVNRGAWWAYILGSLVIGLVVYFGTVGVGLLVDGIVLLTPNEAADAFGFALSRPYVIAAALIAREVSMWSGSVISYRGGKLRLRNAEARAAFDREVAEKRAEYERANATA
ncbi:hypothetical protein BH09ACT3_BH09ACT3_06690 [soil metagenome]